MKRFIFCSIVGLLFIGCASQQQYATKAEVATLQTQLSQLSATSGQHEKVIGLVVPYVNAHEMILTRARDKGIGITEAHRQLVEEKKAAEVKQLEKK